MNPKPHSGKFIAYYRVSTQRQGRSGLGLEAQQSAVRDYLNGGDWRLVAELTEVESGKRSDRPKLLEALKLCRVHGATLIIAKLDRLTRNVAFISNLMESGVDFCAVDFPQANKLTIHILAAVAEHEAKMISERTKVALAAAKKRGVKLGGQRRYVIGKDAAGNKIYGDAVVGPAMATRRARARRQEIADAKAADLAPIIESLKAAGKTTLRAIADGLNDAGIPAVRGGEWSAVQVQRVMARPFEASASA